MNEKEAREWLAILLHPQYECDKIFIQEYARGYLEAIEKFKPVIEWIESLGIPKKDILDYWEKEK